MSKRDANVVEETPISPEGSIKRQKKTSEDDPRNTDAWYARETINLVPVPRDTTTVKIISWNVNGLRAVVKNNPKIFNELVAKYNPDIICLQETKLQAEHEADHIGLLDGYTTHFLSSKDKKGYSGVAVLVKGIDTSSSSSGVKSKATQKTLASMWGKKDEPAAAPLHATVAPHLRIQSLAFELGDKRFSGEGRTITAEFPSFYLVACYVPNSGSDLERLSYRTEQWDVHMRQYLCELREKKPVVFCGDLNVGHLDLDIYNPTAKHIDKQSGLTPEERASFQVLLDLGFVDAFRYLHPEARGQFTWWSMRTNARPVNKGLRLDYFVCSDTMIPGQSDDVKGEGKAEILDSYIIHKDTIGLSDHCPIMLVLKV